MLVSIALQPIITNATPAGTNRLLFTLVTVMMECMFTLPVLAVETKLTHESFRNFIGSVNTWKEHWWRFLAIGLIFASATFLVIFGYASTDPISGAIAVRLQPVSMLVIGYLFLGEDIRKTQVLFTGIMLLSIYYMSTGGSWLLGDFSHGIIFLLIAPILWNVGHSIAKRILETRIISTPQLVVIRTGLSSVILVIVYFMIDGGASAWQLLDPSYTILMVLMGLNYMIQHYFLYKAMTYIDLSVVTAIMIPSPVLTTIFSAVIFGQVIQMHHVIGMVGAFTGLYGLLFFKIKRSGKEASSPVDGEKLV